MRVKHNHPQFDALCIAAFAGRKLASSFLCWGSGAFRRTLFFACWPVFDFVAARLDVYQTCLRLVKILSFCSFQCCS
jgi:hypothetical protein